MTQLTIPPVEPLRAGRRTVVVAAGLTGAAAIGVPLGVRALPELFAGSAAAARPLDRASFAPHVGTSFRAAHEAGTVALELVAVLDDPTAPGDPDSFGLDFASEEHVAQGTYELSRPGFAAAPVFLVPAPPARRAGALAVFNRPEGVR